MGQNGRATDQSEQMKKGKAAKPLPTPRMAFSKQIEVIRAYAAACGNTAREVTNKEVADIVGLKPETVSLANGFLCAIGLLAREDKGYIPCQGVMAFNRSHEWNPESASHKLGPVLEKAWFAEVLMPHLRFRQMPVEEAIAELADAASVSPDYKPQLEMILDFMVAGGLIVRDNGLIKLAKTTSHAESPKGTAEPVTTTPKPGAECIAEEKREHDPPEGTVDFPLYFKGKRRGVIRVPQDLDEEDCQLIELTIPVIKAYAAQGAKK